MMISLLIFVLDFHCYTWAFSSCGEGATLHCGVQNPLLIVGGSLVAGYGALGAWPQ